MDIDGQRNVLIEYQTQAAGLTATPRSEPNRSCCSFRIKPKVAADAT